jgi:hypothetical protein
MCHIPLEPYDTYPLQAYRALQSYPHPYPLATRKLYTLYTHIYSRSRSSARSTGAHCCQFSPLRRRVGVKIMCKTLAVFLGLGVLNLMSLQGFVARRLPQRCPTWSWHHRHHVW